MEVEYFEVSKTKQQYGQRTATHVCVCWRRLRADLARTAALVSQVVEVRGQTLV